VSTGAISCTVLIDEDVINDGCAVMDEHSPTVLSGLRVSWGRNSSVDQPAPSSCTFEILDPLVGARLVPSLTIGRRVDVRTDTVIYPDPDVSTIPAMIPSEVANAVAVVNPAGTTVAVSGPAPSAVMVTFPPLPYTPNPLGWDAVPRTLPGQDWRFQVTVTLPPGPFAGWNSWAATAVPVTFTKPDGSDSTALTPEYPATPTVDVTFTPPAGVWLGLRVRVYPVGPAWTELDGTAWDASPAQWTWDALGTFVITAMRMLAPAAGAAQSAMVFSGRITDISTRWDGGPDAFVSIIAQDWLAELANRVVGDTPWAMEALGTRAQRIVQLSGQPITLTVDTAPAALPVTYRDVDRQPATTLLQQLATSAGAVLWTATHLVTGQVMRVEDIGARPAAQTLTAAGSGLVHVIPAPATLNALPLSSCDVDAEPVRFDLDMTDTVSMVSLQWVEQTVGTEGEQKPTQRTIDVSDASVVAAIGARRLSVSTQLAQSADAQAQATGWLARSSVLAWRINNLRWDTAGLLSPDDVSTVMTLLDGTQRIGLPLTLTEIPEWAWPVAGGHAELALYVEGGTYEYHAGAWQLELNTSSATASSLGVFPWTASEPAWNWDLWDPGVSWLDLYGVTYPPEL
jgi:hypothetical protein